MNLIKSNKNNSNTLSIRDSTFIDSKSVTIICQNSNNNQNNRNYFRVGFVYSGREREN